MRDKPFTCDRCGVSDASVRHDSASGVNLHESGTCPLMVAGMPPASSPAHDPLTLEKLRSAESRLAEEQATIREIEDAAVACGYDRDGEELVADWIRRVYPPPAGPRRT